MIQEQEFNLETYTWLRDRLDWVKEQKNDFLRIWSGFTGPIQAKGKYRETKIIQEELLRKFCIRGYNLSASLEEVIKKWLRERKNHYEAYVKPYQRQEFDFSWLIIKTIYQVCQLLTHEMYVIDYYGALAKGEIVQDMRYKYRMSFEQRINHNIDTLEEIAKKIYKNKNNLDTKPNVMNKNNKKSK